jgi:cation diffusion facilitator family transporter
MSMTTTSSPSSPNPSPLDSAAAIRGKRDAARWSLASNTTLLVLKLVVGSITGSAGILAEAVHSAADLAGSAVAYFSVRASDEPPDRLHAYGHGKIENLSGAATASLILIGGGLAVTEAVSQLLHGGKIVSVGWGMGVMLVSALGNWVVSRHLVRAGRATDSPAITADGHHLQTDVVTSLGVLLGLVLVHVTGQRWWDSVAALGVSLLILRVGYSLAREAVQTLSDTALPPEEEEALTKVLTANPAVIDFHKLRTRKSGSHRHVDVHVLIADTHTFVQAHRLTEDLEDELRLALPNLHPIIHIEPYEDEVQHQRERHGQ